MQEPTGSMGPFLEAYMNQTQKRNTQKRAHLTEATDVLALFLDRGVSSISIFEIASSLMIRDSEAKALSKELEKKKIVAIKRMLAGEYFVELTRLGKQLIKD